MSHFSVIVLVKPEELLDHSKSAVESHLEPILERYDENREVEEYETQCYCVNYRASGDAFREAQTHFSMEEDGEKIIGMDVFRQKYRELPGTEEDKPKWEDFIKPFKELEQSILDKHPMKDKPNPDCEDCGGTGTRMTTNNPESKWDFWLIGGRWTGLLDPDYDPQKDIRNLETCTVCGGTGDQEGLVAYDDDGNRVFADENAEACNGCNGCNGTGKSLKWKLAPYEKDIRLLSEVEITDEILPFSVVTPDGEWHQRADMGWWAIMTNENDNWDNEAKEILEQHKDHIAVVVDCHI